ncbi:MAG: hypothetical protein AAF296_02105 [Pseudomonadota bacterium]
MITKLGFSTRSLFRRRHMNISVSIALSSILIATACSGESERGAEQDNTEAMEAPVDEGSMLSKAPDVIETSVGDADKDDVVAEGVPPCPYLDDAGAAAILPNSGNPIRDGSKDHYCGWRFSGDLSVRIDVFDLEKTLAEEAVSPPLAPQSPEPGPGENAALTMGLFAQSEPRGFRFDYAPRRVQITAVGRGASPDVEGLREAAFTIAERLEKLGD